MPPGEREQADRADGQVDDDPVDLEEPPAEHVQRADDRGVVDRVDPVLAFEQPDERRGLGGDPLGPGAVPQVQQVGEADAGGERERRAAEIRPIGTPASSVLVFRWPNPARSIGSPWYVSTAVW